MHAQAELQAEDIPVHTAEVEPRKLQLYALKRGRRVEGGLGHIEVAAWVAPTGALGRLGQSNLEGGCCRQDVVQHRCCKPRAHSLLGASLLTAFHNRFTVAQ